MIDVSNGNETCYYHYDGSGNVVALSDSTGDTVQTYEYSVYGQVAAEDPNHPNPYMFAGMRFEAETGLYFCGGPVYNPNIGRYLQQNFGIHWQMYSYRINYPSFLVDIDVLTFVRFVDKTFGFIDLGEDVPDDALWSMDFSSIDAWMEWAAENPDFGFEDMLPVNQRVGWKIANDNEYVFWSVQALIYLGYEEEYYYTIKDLEAKDVKITTIGGWNADSYFDNRREEELFNHVVWNSEDTEWEEKADRRYYHFHPLVMLAHELEHAVDYHDGGMPYKSIKDKIVAETRAVEAENKFRWLLTKKDRMNPQFARPSYGFSILYPDDFNKKTSAEHLDISWDQYWGWGDYAEDGPWAILP
jgi:RHS repeat-associated protein